MPICNANSVTDNNINNSTNRLTVNWNWPTLSVNFLFKACPIEEIDFIYEVVKRFQPFNEHQRHILK